MIRYNNTKFKEGFTIIEVVLVLAIAGLIFLMVFVAFPALQRGQRDTQRRDDMARFASQLAQYQSNNYGRVPPDVKGYSAFIADYLRTNGDTFADPSGSDYEVGDANACDTSDNQTDENGNKLCKQLSNVTDTANGTIHVYTNAACSGETPYYKQGNKYIAFTYKLEGAGIYCGHN